MLFRSAEAQRWDCHCFCGEVEFTVSGILANQSACHCKDCRAWSGAALLHYASIKPVTPDEPTVTITKGEKEFHGSYSLKGTIDRHFCKRCGSHLFVFVPSIKAYFPLSSVLAASKQGFPLKAATHMHYPSRVMDVTEGKKLVAFGPDELVE